MGLNLIEAFLGGNRDALWSPVRSTGSEAWSSETAREYARPTDRVVSSETAREYARPTDRVVSSETAREYARPTDRVVSSGTAREYAPPTGT
jgi:hypothetical protein